MAMNAAALPVPLDLLEASFEVLEIPKVVIAAAPLLVEETYHNYESTGDNLEFRLSRVSGRPMLSKVSA
jgi:hypothetical protein